MPKTEAANFGTTLFAPDRRWCHKMVVSHCDSGVECRIAHNQIFLMKKDCGV